MKNQSDARLIRAIGSEYLRRTAFMPVIIMYAVLVLGLAVSIWLATGSAGWWVLVAILGIGLVVLSIATLIGWFVLKLLRPDLTADTHKAVNDYVDTYERVMEKIQTPPPIILFWVLLDIIRPQKRHYIADFSQDSQFLVKEFQKLRLQCAKSETKSTNP